MRMTIHALETRLDQLKDIQQWAKIDPTLLRFAEASPGPLATVSTAAPPRPQARRSAVIPLLVGALALLAGWLLSLVLPATILLGR
jgi:hypothetical protein